MIEWYKGLETYSQALFLIAGVATVLLIIQIILMIIGFDHNDVEFDAGDMDVDFDPNGGSFFGHIGGMRILSVRNVIVFLATGPWVALLVREQNGDYWLSILLGIVSGLIVMILFAFAIKKMEDMQSDGTVDYANSIGQIASVYLTIPKEKSGKGKVHVTVQERLVEIDAVTEGEEIPTGSEVIVESYDLDRVVVKRKENK